MKKIAFSAFVIFGIGLTIFLLYMTSVVNNVNKSYTPRKITKLESVEILPAQSLKDNISVLLIGVDNKNKLDNSQRADSMIIISYNVKTNKAKMTRLPRDIYIDLPDYTGKLNGIYHDLGRSELIQVIENYIDIPIRYYVETDFKGLTNIIDSIGGIDINSQITIDDSNNQQIGHDIYIKKGFNHLNGKEALGYSRIRYIDNDIERGNRQEQVIKAIVKKLMSPSQLPNISSNAAKMSEYVKTDIHTSDIINHIESLTTMPKIEPVKFEWEGFEYEGGSYVKLSDLEREKLSKIFRSNLELPEKDLPVLVLEPTIIN